MKDSKHDNSITFDSDCEQSAITGSSSTVTPPFPAFGPAKVSTTYTRGSTIFMEGQIAKGAYLLCSGRVKLSTCSEDGKTIILRIAEPGEVLGLGATLNGTSHENTAHAIEDAQVGFIKRDDFVLLVQTRHDAALVALKQLSSNYQKAHFQVCSLGLSSSAGDKLAKLLLQWCEAHGGSRGVRITKRYTHSEIAEMIGSSRETVTRMLSDFRDRGLIAFSRTELLIPDCARLKAIIGTRHRNGNGADHV